VPSLPPLRLRGWVLSARESRSSRRRHLPVLRALLLRLRLLLGVAVQVGNYFLRQSLKPVFHLIGARVETTWVPGAFQLWVRGSQQPVQPPASAAARMNFSKRERRSLCVGTSLKRGSDDISVQRYKLKN
jgi:hypothetical protein